MLVADSDAPYLMQLKGFFEAAGFEVDTACDLAAVFLFLERQHFSVVILELRLDNHYGEQGASVLLLTTAVAPHTPIIVITGRPSVEDVRDTLGPNPHGPPAADFISKDEGMEVLLKSVRDVVADEGSFPVAVSA
jgi:DNA-binding NtrC family response regulator